MKTHSILTQVNEM